MTNKKELEDIEWQLRKIHSTLKDFMEIMHSFSNNNSYKGNENKIGNRLIPVPRWHDYHPWPSQASFRYWIFNEKTNGFTKVIRRIGRRVMIDEQAFFEWTKNNNVKI